MDLPNSIRKYYLDNFNLLPQDKQFHFLSRLSSWDGDEQTTNMLADQKKFLFSANLSQEINSLIHNPPEAKINAFEARKPYFKKYPNLRGESFALFRVRHLLSLFGIDVRNILTDSVSEKSLHETSQRLLADPDAIRILSTYAVNFLFLTESILFPQTRNPISFDYFIQLSDIYNKNNSTEIQLLIYLYTHCIIGASNFYRTTLSNQASDGATRMLDELEHLIGENYGLVNLDNKLEFLVCCNIVGKKTLLSERVLSECSQSISNDGIFVVDTVNSHAQSDKTSFADSEHRNVLLIMASRQFRPELFKQLS